MNSCGQAGYDITPKLLTLTDIAPSITVVPRQLLDDTNV